MTVILLVKARTVVCYTVLLHQNEEEVEKEEDRENGEGFFSCFLEFEDFSPETNLCKLMATDEES